jgi:hypothetical protein
MRALIDVPSVKLVQALPSGAVIVVAVGALVDDVGVVPVDTVARGPVGPTTGMPHRTSAHKKCGGLCALNPAFWVKWCGTESQSTASFIVDDGKHPASVRTCGGAMNRTDVWVIDAFVALLTWALGATDDGWVTREAATEELLEREVVVHCTLKLKGVALDEGEKAPLRAALPVVFELN